MYTTAIVNISHDDDLNLSDDFVILRYCLLFNAHSDTRCRIKIYSARKNLEQEDQSTINANKILIKRNKLK